MPITLVGHANNISWSEASTLAPYQRSWAGSFTWKPPFPFISHLFNLLPLIPYCLTTLPSLACPWSPKLSPSLSKALGSKLIQVFSPLLAFFSHRHHPPRRIRLLLLMSISLQLRPLARPSSLGCQPIYLPISMSMSISPNEPSRPSPLVYLTRTNLT